MKTKTIFHIVLVSILFFSVSFTHNQCFAVTPEAERIAVEAKVRAEVNKDLAMPYKANESLAGRHGIDGRKLTDDLNNFQGDIVEFWLNLECGYCSIQEPLKAQRKNENMRIIVRHLPSDSYGESLKKALSYEALKIFSTNAANMFWDTIIPKTSLAIPVPYKASLMVAFQEAAISPEAFSNALEGEATDIINEDILAGHGRIISTPTYVLEGIRFSACNFTAEQLSKALKLAKKTRMGDAEAKEQVIDIIVQGLLGEVVI